MRCFKVSELDLGRNACREENIWTWVIGHFSIVFWFLWLLLKLVDHLKGIHTCWRNKRDMCLGNSIKCQLKLSWLRVCFLFSGEQVIWMEPWALCELGKHFTTELCSKERLEVWFKCIFSRIYMYIWYRWYRYGYSLYRYKGVDIDLTVVCMDVTTDWIQPLFFFGEVCAITGKDWKIIVFTKKHDSILLCFAHK